MKFALGDLNASVKTLVIISLTAKAILKGIIFDCFKIMNTMDFLLIWNCEHILT